MFGGDYGTLLLYPQTFETATLNKTLNKILNETLNESTAGAPLVPSPVTLVSFLLLWPRNPWAHGSTAWTQLLIVQSRLEKPAIPENSHLQLRLGPIQRRLGAENRKE